MKALDGIAFAASLVLTILLTISVLYDAPNVTHALFGEPRVSICFPNLDSADFP